MLFMIYNCVSSSPSSSINVLGPNTSIAAQFTLIVIVLSLLYPAWGKH